MNKVPIYYEVLKGHLLGVFPKICAIKLHVNMLRVFFIRSLISWQVFINLQLLRISEAFN